MLISIFLFKYNLMIMKIIIYSFNLNFMIDLLLIINNLYFININYH